MEAFLKRFHGMKSKFRYTGIEVLDFCPTPTLHLSMELKHGLTHVGIDKYEVYLFPIIKLLRNLHVCRSGMGITKLAKLCEFQCLNIT